ncbi:MAG: signal peptidase II [Terriglobia bacterium]
MGKSKIQNLKSKIDKPSAMTPRVKVMTRIVLALIAAAVFAADQLTKHLVERRLPDGAVVRVIPGFFNLITTKNSGAVFGLFNDSTASWKTPLLIAVSAILLIVVVFVVARTRRLHWGSAIGLSLILGGALSNLFDRMRTGLVEDFLDFYIRSYHWAAFNLADSAIVIGAGFLILQVLLSD